LPVNFSNRLVRGPVGQRGADSGAAGHQAPPRPPYEFSADWFSGNIYLFTRNLTHLKGTPCRILEIGSFEGRSTIWMLENLATHPRAHITCIDPSVRDTFLSNIGKTGRAGQVRLIRGRSGDVVGRLAAGEFDFIYVDGSHAKADVLEDAVLSFRVARPGAVIAFDDYLEDGPQWNPRDFAKPAIDAFLDIYTDRLKILERCHQIWVRKLGAKPDHD
jgi:predicted O-methyltransferase YrrM